MRAVYESRIPYAQVGYWDVNAVAKVLSMSTADKQGVYRAGEIVGDKINLPEDESQRNRSYCFMQGNKHNQLILEDPKEIQNMRAWVKCHQSLEDWYFKEVYYEADPVEEIPEEPEQEEPVEALVDPVEEDPTEEPIGSRIEHSSLEDWDIEMEKRINR